MMKKEILRSIASITKRVGGDLASPVIDKIYPADSKTFTGDVIEADGTMDSFSGDIIIEGKTLQNIMPDLNDINYLMSSNVDIINSGEYVLRSEPSGGQVFIGPKLEMFPIRYNTMYTLMTEYSPINSKNFNYIKYLNGYKSLITGYDANLDNSLDYLLQTVKTPMNKPVDAILGFRCLGESTSNAGSGSVTFKNMMCIAGEHNMYPMHYFKNIHSLGERGKIYLKSSNKNVFPSSNNFKDGDFKSTFPNETKIQYINGNAHITKLTDNGGRQVIFTPKLFLKKGVKYYIVVEMETTDDSKLAIAIRNANSASFIFNSPNTTDSVKKLGFISNTTGYFNIAFSTTNMSKNATVIIKSCYFGTSNMGGEFIPHEENIIEIPVSQPLRSIETLGVSDKIIKKGNTYYIERNVGRYDVSSENMNAWKVHVLGNETSTIAFVNDDLLDAAVRGIDDTKIYTVSSLLKGDSHWRIYNEKETLDTGVSLSQSSRLYIRILKNTILENDTLDGFKDYICDNPFYILYPLKQPVYEKLDVDEIQVELYPEMSVISTYDECIHGKTTIDVPLNITSIISNDIRKINSLEKELIKAEKTVLVETMNLISIDEQFNNHKQKI